MIRRHEEFLRLDSPWEFAFDEKLLQSPKREENVLLALFYSIARGLMISRCAHRQPTCRVVRNIIIGVLTAAVSLIRSINSSVLD